MIQAPEPHVLRDRIRGMMLGAAIGDALGSAFEMVRSSGIHKQHGPIIRKYYAGAPGSLLDGRAPGNPTDDTAMALSLATAISERSEATAASIAARFTSDLARGGAFGDMFWDGGPGNACVAMLYAVEHGARPFESIDPNAGGNGAAMRAHPCAVLPSPGAVAELAAMQARLSHPHPAAVASAQVVALIDHAGLYGGRLSAALPATVSDGTMRDAWAYYHDVREQTGPLSEPLPARLRDVNMAGWNTVAAAHSIATLFENDFAAGVGAAAASGEDTDTIASIVGGMLGAVHGAGGLPAHLLKGLAYRATIERVADALADAVERVRSA